MARLCLVLKSRRVPKYRVRTVLRCEICGRPRGTYRKFRVCRICIRMLALRGEVPGMRKASW